MNKRPLRSIDPGPPDAFDQGLQFDLRTLLQRRHALKLLGGAAAFALVGCGDDEDPASTATGTTQPASATTSGASATGTGTSGASATPMVTAIPRTATPISACTALPEETAGPYPGDGSNGPNVLNQSGIVRSDIKTSFSVSDNEAEGVPLTVTLTLVDTEDGCEPMAGAALYLWHCDRDGNYSLYTAADEDYLRGVQEADANGQVTFETIFPGCYSGRWPHIHFEVYPSLAQATSSANKVATSQLALPEDSCDLVYATAGYESSVTNLSRITFASDNVFSDGADLQLAEVEGSVAAGFTATLIVGV